MSSLTLTFVAPQWNTLSFTSTLFLKPILDLLLRDVPPCCQDELRLGLQEALVNASHHGNELNPDKVVLVRYSMVEHQCWWVITDQGMGFSPPRYICSAVDDLLPEAEAESGRGLFLIYEIFDEVYWNGPGTELSLCKDLERYLQGL
ncbi:anti-sigma regulatory factor [Candidatus Synechococcus calcipolaris G9]|uniref:Anti-sigma regulatory factor n=1 Tax=Candidatus Synechococcus calcipolaris G9 TaxID=1497997 RepID=A0ABT6F0M9_9SYNE|nr:anti-sigma regulatory factor [Candidatus Synechococcus calcipolaris]MDG2991416.1 anti-sigma regulatory factor [Candidatus Synechococcus calcipolaris G9]